jgi:dipeptidyl aminopeptidase/acylaminoacyl peptidase
MWENKECPLSQAFVDDINKINNVLSKTEKIEVPWLIVHGDADDVVPVEESQEDLRQRLRAEGDRHPPRRRPRLQRRRAKRQMIEAVVSWLKGHHI